MSEHDKWHWQEGRIWRGIGIYHVTMVVSNRQPLLGNLIIPDNDPVQARVDRTELGEAIIKNMFQIPDFHPEVEILQFCLMPDHIHMILRVTRSMPKGIASVVRGFWQGAKKAYLLYNNPNTIRKNGRSEKLEGVRKNGRSKGDTVFTEKPFIRPLSHKGQLQAMIRYVQMNPQRLATKLLMPGFFRVQEDIEIAGRTYRGIGNTELLQAIQYAPVHVRRTMVEEAEHGDNKRLRDYMNGCVLNARNGSVMVSPFISQQEKAVMDVLIKEKHPIIYIADNGFRDYYKPSDSLFDAVAEGRVLILSPWEYDSSKRHVTRAECVAMNRMAEEICEALSSPNVILSHKARLFRKN